MVSIASRPELPRDSGQPGQTPARRVILEAAGLVILAIALFLFHLGRYGLWEPDEARYAEIAREMLARGNLLVPHLNYVPYVEKPPLLFWLTAISFKVFGLTEFAA